MSHHKIRPALLKVMGDRDWTLKELSAVTGYTADGIKTALRGMDAHISGWKPTPRATPSAMWRLGKGSHAPKPLPDGKNKKQSYIDNRRLREGYIKSERITWGGLCL